MKLAGDIVVGPAQFHRADTYSILDSPPAALVFRDGVDHHVTYFGVIVRNDSTADRVALIPSPRVTTPSRNLLFSTAPLEDVTKVDIYTSQYTGLCVGILLHYQSRGQRALGQCRLGVDAVETHLQPNQICVKRIRFADLRSGEIKESAAIDCTTERSHEHGDEGWVCYALQGSFEVCFDNAEFQVTHAEAPLP